MKEDTIRTKVDNKISGPLLERYSQCSQRQACKNIESTSQLIVLHIAAKNLAIVRTETKLHKKIEITILKEIENSQ